MKFIKNIIKYFQKHHLRIFYWLIGIFLFLFLCCPNFLTSTFGLDAIAVKNYISNQDYYVTLDIETRNAVMSEINKQFEGKWSRYSEAINYVKPGCFSPEEEKKRLNQSTVDKDVELIISSIQKSKENKNKDDNKNDENK